MKKLIQLTLLCCLQLAAYADGYWLEVKGRHKAGQAVTIRVCYGGVSDSGSRYWKTGAELNKMAGFAIYVQQGGQQHKPVTLTQKQDGWEGSFTPAVAGSYRITGIHETLPVVDRSAEAGVSIKPVQYLCALYTVGDKEEVDATPAQLLDIIATRQGSLINLQTFIDFHPAAGAKLRVFNPDNWERAPVTDSAGKASFIARQKGLYLVRLDWVDKQAGSYKGVKYSNIRHRCDYSLWVE